MLGGKSTNTPSPLIPTGTTFDPATLDCGTSLSAYVPVNGDFIFHGWFPLDLGNIESKVETVPDGDVTVYMPGDTVIIG